MIKFLQFRLGDVISPEQGTITREVAEGQINQYLKDGWVINTVVSAGYNQYGTELVVVLSKPVVAK